MFGSTASINQITNRDPETIQVEHAPWVINQPNFRFPKSARILTSKEFKRVASQARRFSTRYFILLVQNTNHPPPRIGLTVSRKTGNAVVRSRIKRVIREFFRLQRSCLTPNIHCVIIAKPLAGQTINAELTRNLQELFVQFKAA